MLVIGLKFRDPLSIFLFDIVLCWFGFECVRSECLRWDCRDAGVGSERSGCLADGVCFEIGLRLDLMFFFCI